MPSHLSRRDFLKLSASLSMLPLVGALPESLRNLSTQDPAHPNIIVIVFDAMAARHLSLYGYPRKTSSNFERLAQRSTVYHAHHAAANFTTPSTASLFTSSYPWTHRAISLSGLVTPEVKPRNLLQLLGDSYYQAAFVQNVYADILLYQFKEHINRHMRSDSYSESGVTIYDHLFPNDAVMGAKSFDQFLFEPKEKPGSLFLSIPVELYRQIGKRLAAERTAKTNPDGLPTLRSADVFFSIEEVVQGVKGLVSSLPAPFFAYLHFMPPHAPYIPSSNFRGKFNDGWAPEPKKKHRLASGTSQERLNELRQSYDEFIADIDIEFGKLIDHMEETGILDNSYVVVTADHGEFFERGEHGHVTPLLYEPITRIPLLISQPGQRERRDIYTLTSNVDVTPTLLKIAGKEIPDTCEGRVLPGFGGEETNERSVFVVEAKKNPAYQPLDKASVAIIRGQYKLIQYLGYRYKEGFEFYDLENDPEELDDLYDSHPAVKDMQAELEDRLKQADQPYTRNA